MSRRTDPPPVVDGIARTLYIGIPAIACAMGMAESAVRTLIGKYGLPAGYVPIGPKGKRLWAISQSLIDTWILSFNPPQEFLAMQEDASHGQVRQADHAGELPQDASPARAVS